MSVNFEWEEDYNVGIEEIDSQHKRFLALIQRIHDLKHSTPESSGIQKLVEELEKYLVFHTKSEELLMILYSYPKHNEQKEEHLRVIEKVREKIDKLPGQPEDLNDLLIYLMKWFINHTTYLDKDLGEHIKQQRSA